MHSCIYTLLPVYKPPLSSKVIGSGVHVCFVEMSAHERRARVLITKERKVDTGVCAKLVMLKEKRKRDRCDTNCG